MDQLPDNAKLRTFLVEVARDVWRLRQALVRKQDMGVEVGDSITDVLSRLEQDLEGFGIAILDPAGETYQSGVSYEIVQLEPGGSGDLVVERTVFPGVAVDGRLLSPPGVVLSRRGT